MSKNNMFDDPHYFLIEHLNHHNFFMVKETLSTVRQNLNLSHEELGKYVNLNGELIKKIEDGLIEAPPHAATELKKLVAFYTKATEKSKSYARVYKYIFDRYDLIGPVVINKPMTTGVKANRKCRYCGRTGPEVTFRKEAHTLPAFIGNRFFKSYDECDECNEIFSKYETSFSQYMGLSRTISRTKTRSGVPKYKRTNELGIAINANNQTEIHVKKDSDLVKIDEVNKKFTFFHKTTYIPIHIYKILTKMALAVMPEEELGAFETTKSWLLGKREELSILNPKMYYALTTFTPGIKPYGEFISYILFRRKNTTDRIPYMMFFVAFTNFSFQIPILFSEKDNYLLGKDITIFRFPGLYPKPSIFGETKFREIDLSSSDKITSESSISVSYKYGVKVELSAEEWSKNFKPLYLA